MRESRRSITEHLSRALDLAPTPQPVYVPVERALNHVLAADARAKLPVPPFSNSAMDGFLVHGADLSPSDPVTLPVAGDVPAGGAATTVPPGRAVRIMTGAPVGDPVADGLRVVPVEDTDQTPGPHRVPSHVTLGSVDHDRAHIRVRGENTTPGEVVVSAGTRVDPGALAALISVGVAEVAVYPLPRVAVVSSGDELIPAGRVPSAGQLPDSNQPMLAALLGRDGVENVIRIHTGDSPAEFRDGLDDAAARADLVITTGGVSAGAYDVVREVAGAEQVWFGPVAMQPGKPQGLGRWAGVPLVCLPGNPVAVFVSHHLFVSPLLRALAGQEVPADVFARPHLTARVTTEFPAPRGRPLLVPVRLDWSTGQPVAAPFTPAGRGSHLVASLAGVDGLAVLPPEESGPVPGGDVQVLLLR